MKTEYQLAQTIAAYFKRSIRSNTAFSMKIDKDIPLTAQAKREGMSERIKCISLIVFRASDYAKAKAVQGREVEAPAWKENIEIDGVTFGRHKTKRTLYLGFPVMSFGKSAWFLDGKQVTKESLRPYLVASAFKEAPSRDELKAIQQTVYRSPKVTNVIEIV